MQCQKISLNINFEPLQDGSDLKQNKNYNFHKIVFNAVLTTPCALNDYQQFGKRYKPMFVQLYVNY
jgi:hypothetical protein